MNWPHHRDQRELLRIDLAAGGSVVVTVIGRPRLSEALDILEQLIKNKRSELERNGFSVKVQS